MRLSAMRSLELGFTPEGTAELIDAESDDVLWSSDDDDDFRDDFNDELLTVEKDGESVVEWLVENDVISEEESEDVKLFAEDADAEDDDDDVPGDTFDAEAN